MVEFGRIRNVNPQLLFQQVKIYEIFSEVILEMCMGVNGSAFTQAPHWKRIAFHCKVRSFEKAKQSIAFDSQGICIYIYI